LDARTSESLVAQLVGQRRHHAAVQLDDATMITLPVVHVRQSEARGDLIGEVAKLIRDLERPLPHRGRFVMPPDTPEARAHERIEASEATRVPKALDERLRLSE
jgi:hypothetical protein